MTEPFTAPHAGLFGTTPPPAFVGLPEGTTTVVEFETIEWQTVPPRVFARLVGAPGFEIYHDVDRPIEVMARRSADGIVTVEARSNSDGHVPQDERLGAVADSRRGGGVPH